MRRIPLILTLAAFAAALANTAAPAAAAPTHSTTIAARTLQTSPHAGPHIQPALKQKVAALPDSDAGVGHSFGLEPVQ
jgi:hypothetical protein